MMSPYITSMKMPAIHPKFEAPASAPQTMSARQAKRAMAEPACFSRPARACTARIPAHSSRGWAICSTMFGTVSALYTAWTASE